MAKFLKSQDFKTTFKQNLTCIFYLSELIQKTQFAMADPVWYVLASVTHFLSHKKQWFKIAGFMCKKIQKQDFEWPTNQKAGLIHTSKMGKTDFKGCLL